MHLQCTAIGGGGGGLSVFKWFDYFDFDYVRETKYGKIIFIHKIFEKFKRNLNNTQCVMLRLSLTVCSLI